MPRFGPISRQELIRNLRLLGFDGPFSGGKHQFMTTDTVTVRIPNPHRGDIGIGLPGRILHQAGIDRETWDKL
jgi:predicted RNA binding protein YcfA (HicA-like mRNA interferase family)